MFGKREISTVQSGPSTSAEAWGLRYPGLVMGAGGKNEVKEFTGMWRLKPDADLVAFTKALAPGGWINPPGESFPNMMTKLGLIRTARWFVARTQDFDGYTLFFISQFRRHPGEILRRFRSEREGEPLGDLGQLRWLPDRPECDGA